MPALTCIATRSLARRHKHFNVSGVSGAQAVSEWLQLALTWDSEVAPSGCAGAPLQLSFFEAQRRRRRGGETSVLVVRLLGG
ncbi:hypothetical protein AAFF_G00317030 [Aldrovandia affinis]|uniref:Uncharacterized protein n=1 Tax=Aldrovandia affinis TaxID=143900 RepID=A0AAD7W0B9_9TELE|nr:hypothetical protein AAFF_G00317030 [Aldrovandia affinis]